MSWRAAATALLCVAAWSSHARADFNACLGVEISALPSIDECGVLYDACQAGVSKLNQQLKLPMSNLFHPVSVISATESKAKFTNATTVAVLLQLAPIDHCEYSTVSPAASALSSEKCTFDMTKVEIYSILLMEEKPQKWSLDGYKHHSLSAEDRAQIVAEYKSGKFYGSNLAIGIFDTPNLPVEASGNAGDSAFTRSPIGIFAVVASATVSIGLLFHHRRRLHNGYAPIVIMKRGQVQGKNVGGTQYTEPRAKPIAAEEVSLKPDTNERFAV